jgi:phosphoglycerate-specific signal transduction histidine kinase
MAKQKITYEVDDALSLDDNLAVLREKLTALHPDLGPKLGEMLSALMQNLTCDKEAMLTSLRATLDAPHAETPAASPAAPAKVAR